MDSKLQPNAHPRSSLQGFTPSSQLEVDFDLATFDRSTFDLWAVEVRQQMLATIRRREGSRSNWGRIQQSA